MFLIVLGLSAEPVGLVAGACNGFNVLSLPFRLELVSKA